MAERAQNLQDTFLNYVRKNKTPLTIFLVNGVKLAGHRHLVRQFLRSCCAATGIPSSSTSTPSRRSCRARRCSSSSRARMAPPAGRRIERQLTHDPRRRTPKVRRRLRRRRRAPWCWCPILEDAAGAGRPRPRGPRRGGGRPGAGDRTRRRRRRRGAACQLRGRRRCSAPARSRRSARRWRPRRSGWSSSTACCRRCSSAISNGRGRPRSSTAPGLILEIFGERAQTREGTLQVELAHLNYQKSRLVRSWTHLERQRGGFGFLGGPGETQIEADRRMIEERIARIERDLENVVTRRRQQRKTRRKGSQATVALVGYTNAGKSTLFNALTADHVFADNRLFATLDPTLRRVTLPHGADRDPVRHRRLRRRPADDAGRRLPRHAGGGGRGRRDPARARHRRRRQRGAGARRRRGARRARRRRQGAGARHRGVEQGRPDAAGAAAAAGHPGGSGRRPGGGDGVGADRGGADRPARPDRGEDRRQPPHLRGQAGGGCARRTFTGSTRSARCSTAPTMRTARPLPMCAWRRSGRTPSTAPFRTRARPSPRSRRTCRHAIWIPALHVRSCPAPAGHPGRNRNIRQARRQRPPGLPPSRERTVGSERARSRGELQERRRGWPGQARP